ncbi:MAG: hypothetical protein R2824_00615 [Saprospiraceae bacterium]|nr:hypothetical protein [Lewinella sp.]
MTQKLQALAVGLILMSIGFSACTNDQLPEPMVLAVCDTLQTSYTSNVKEIIDRSCAYSGCHIDASIGNYLTYEGMLGRLKDGVIRSRVISLRSDPVKGMPPAYSPGDRPKELTQHELEIIQCWLDAGFPKE